MPKAICKKCGKVWHGWALKYKTCFCDCGEKLEIIKDNLKMERTKEPQKFIDRFAKKAFGRSQDRGRRKTSLCFRGKEIKISYFRDELSRRGYKISGICQKVPR